MSHGTTRRAFLAGALGAAGAMVLRGRMAMGDEAKAEALPLRRDGGLVLLPGKGELYVATDFHTRHADFALWLKRTQIVEKLKDREDVYALFLGDAVDKKPGDTSAEDEGDAKIVDRIRQIQADLGKDSGRFIYLQGNHEYQVARIYEAMQKQLGMNRANRKRLVDALFNGPDGAYFSQFNFLHRITEEQLAYVKDLPVAAMSPHGLVATHAGPSPRVKDRKDVSGRDEKVVSDLVWGRPAELLEGGYTEADLAGFLKVMGDGGVLLVGHTPLTSLPEGWVKNGVGVFAKRQLILATSYGASGGRKSYLVIDLAKRFAAVDELRAGHEIQPLEDGVGRGGDGVMAQRLAEA